MLITCVRPILSNFYTLIVSQLKNPKNKNSLPRTLNVCFIFHMKKFYGHKNIYLQFNYFFCVFILYVTWRSLKYFSFALSLDIHDDDEETESAKIIRDIYEICRVWKIEFISMKLDILTQWSNIMSQTYFFEIIINFS